MKNRAIKLIICICVISCLMVGFCTAFASAAEPVWLLRAKAAVASAMLASQLVLNPVDVLLSEPLASAIDPQGKIEWVETLPDYLDRSTIKVLPDTVIIDGVSYSDIWLGPEAANALRLQGLDFATAYNIANNQSTAVTYASGIGYINGAPIYASGQWTYAFSPLYVTTIPASMAIGNSVLSFERNPNVANAYNVFYNGYQGDTGGGYGNTEHGYHFVISRNQTQGTLNTTLTPTQTGTDIFWRQGIKFSFDSSPFDFEYTSGVIDNPIDPEDGLLLRVPTEYTSQSSPQYNYDIHDLVNIYPSITQPGGHEINIDPELNPEFEADIDLGNGVGDLIRTILTLLDVLDNIDIEFAPEPESPEPPPEPGQIDPLPDPDPAPEEPVEGTTIADTDWTKLDEILRWIQSTIDSIRHITESLQTMLDSLFDQLQDIIQALQELPEQLLEDIETGPSKVFRKALDVLKSLFMPLLLPIKAMMNLWHYVVEWIQSISSPFTWIFGVMSGTSFNMVLPIYAVLAGSICIAIYKALGR